MGPNYTCINVFHRVSFFGNYVVPQLYLLAIHYYQYAAIEKNLSAPLFKFTSSLTYLP